MFVIQKHLSQTSYKFMYYIGVNDIACMVINGAITGYLAINGDVYCSKPGFIYITGVCGNGKNKGYMVLGERKSEKN